MKKISSLLILLIVFISALFAQNDANKILSDFAAKAQSYSSISADFQYIMENTNENISDSYNGKLLLKGDKFRLEIAGQVIISDGISIWTYIPDAEEVQVNSAEESEDLFTPAKLFSSYSEDFEASYKKQYSVGPRKIHVLKLIPLDESQGFNKAEMELDAESLQLIRFSLFDNHHNKFGYIVDKFFTDKDLNDNLFTFNSAEYPDVEVIDMR